MNLLFPACFPNRFDLLNFSYLVLAISSETCFPLRMTAHPLRIMRLNEWIFMFDFRMASFLIVLVPNCLAIMVLEPSTSTRPPTPSAHFSSPFRIIWRCSIIMLDSISITSERMTYHFRPVVSISANLCSIAGMVHSFVRSFVYQNVKNRNRFSVFYYWSIAMSTNLLRNNVWIFTV